MLSGSDAAVVVLGTRGSGKSAAADLCSADAAAISLHKGRRVFVSVTETNPRDDSLGDSLAPDDPPGGQPASKDSLSLRDSNATGGSFGGRSKVTVTEDAARGRPWPRGAGVFEVPTADILSEVLAKARTRSALRASRERREQGALDCIISLYVSPEGWAGPPAFGPEHPCPLPCLTIVEVGSTFEDAGGGALGQRKAGPGRPGRTHEALLDVVFALSKRKPNAPLPSFRQAKATQLLRGALQKVDGPPLLCLVLVRASAAPPSVHVDPNVRALSFAERLAHTYRPYSFFFFFFFFFFLLLLNSIFSIQAQGREGRMGAAHPGVRSRE